MTWVSYPALEAAGYVEHRTAKEAIANSSSPGTAMSLRFRAYKKEEGVRIGQSDLKERAK